MAFFSPGFMLGAATRATERIDDARERNEELAEEIKQLTKEHSKIAARAISARAVQDSEFISKAKLILSSSDEGKEILKNVGDSKQTLVAIGREATKRMDLEKNLTPKLFNKALLSKSITPEGKFKNPYNLVQADLTTNPSEEAKQTEELGFGQRLLEGLVGKKPTIEGAVAGMTPQMRAATLESIRTGQPLAARDPVQFAAGQIEVPVFSEKELAAQALSRKLREQERDERRQYNEAREELRRQLRKEDDQERRDRREQQPIENSMYQAFVKGSLATEEIQAQVDFKNGLISQEESVQRPAFIKSLADQLYGALYFNIKRIRDGERVFDAARKIYNELKDDDGKPLTKLTAENIDEIKQVGVDAFIERFKKGDAQLNQTQKQLSKTPDTQSKSEIDTRPIPDEDLGQEDTLDERDEAAIGGLEGRKAARETPGSKTLSEVLSPDKRFAPGTTRVERRKFKATTTPKSQSNATKPVDKDVAKAFQKSKQATSQR